MYIISLTQATITAQVQEYLPLRHLMLTVVQILNFF